MSDFRIVDDALRAKSLVGRQPKPEYEAVASGKTVFIPANGKPRQEAAIRTALRSRGLRVSVVKNTVDDQDGWVVWTTGKRDLR